MIIEQTISSCKAIFEYALESHLLYPLLFFIFIFIPLLTIVTSVIKTYKKAQQLSKSYKQEIPEKLYQILQKHSIDTNLFLVTSQKSFVAVSIGFFSRKIYVSDFLITTLSEQELEAVILHELYHVQQFHALFLFLVDILTKVFFFIPIFRDLQNQVRFQFEKSADAYASSCQKTTLHVKKALKKIILFENYFEVFPQFSYHIVDQRIDSLNSKKTKIFFSQQRFFSSVVVVSVFVSLFLLNNRYAVAATMEEKITCSLFDCVQNCVAYELNKEQPMSKINYSVSR